MLMNHQNIKGSQGGSTVKDHAKENHSHSIMSISFIFFTALFPNFMQAHLHYCNRVLTIELMISHEGWWGLKEKTQWEKCKASLFLNGTGPKRNTIEATFHVYFFLLLLTHQPPDFWFHPNPITSLRCRINANFFDNHTSSLCLVNNLHVFQVDSLRFLFILWIKN